MYTNGQGKSPRAIEAENNGLKTKSQLPAWKKRAIEAGDVTASEWHHTGSKYRRTDYYADSDFDGLKATDYPPATATEKAAKKARQEEAKAEKLTNLRKGVFKWQRVIINSYGKKAYRLVCSNCGFVAKPYTAAEDEKCIHC